MTQYQPTGSLPSAMTGAIEAINTPRLFEAGTAWRFVCSVSPNFLKPNDLYSALTFTYLYLSIAMVSV